MTKEEQVKSEAIQAAKTLFQHYGLNKTTMEDIAKAMGRGKSTLYYYYKSKDEIFEAVVLNEIDEVFINVKNAVDNVSSAGEKLLTYCLTTFKSINTVSVIYKIIMGEISENMNMVLNLRGKFEKKQNELLYNILNQGIVNGEFVSEIKSDIDLLTFSMNSALSGLVIDFVIHKNFPGWENRIDLLINIFLKGLLA
jgi:AcrR family transcriptional regulator